MRSMGKRTRRSLLIVGLTLLITLSAQNHNSKDDTSSTETNACAALIGTTNLASVISADFVFPPFTTMARGTMGPEITVRVPFCRVAGAIKPTPESDIRFELWLPPRVNWNRKFAGVGSGVRLALLNTSE